MKNWTVLRRAAALVSSFAGLSAAMRTWLAALSLAAAMLILPATAAAQSPANVSFTAIPTTFTNPGETIATTLTFNTGNRVFSGLIAFDLNGAFPTATCTPSSSPSTASIISCTANYVVQPTDLGVNLTLRGRVKFSAAGTPVQLGYITTSVTYVPTLVTPTVSGIAPSSGASSGGTSVTISGSDFNSISAVSFGGVAATSFSVPSPNQINAVAPAGTGVVDVQVTNAAGTSATGAADQFTYINPPSVSAVSPNAGTSAGGTTVTITGSNFGAATAVTFGATPAAGFTINSASQITAVAPAGSGTVDVRVTNVAGTSATSAADQFSFIAAPTVTAISPAAGPTAGGTTVGLLGTNFNGATAVSFGGVPATSFTVNSASQIAATAPAGTGTVNIRVTTVGGTSATAAANQYSYLPAPVVTGVAPASGLPAGGTSVTITGSGFTGVTSVNFGGTPAVSYTINSASQITASAPAGSGTVDVRLVSPGGTSAATSADQFTYAGTPVVTALSPSTGPSAGGSSVVITGSNFVGVNTVNFGGTAASFTVNSATQITATAPAGSGVQSVSVISNSGASGASAGSQFTYIAAPTVSAISPTSGPSSGGNSVTITGTGFGSATAVTFGGAPAVGFTVNSGSQITATAPSGSGTVDVQVTNASGASATSAADQYTYLSAPTVSSVAPNAGPTSGGTSVVITGTGFSGATAVTFGATPATGFTVNAANQITATAPAGTGTVDVRVTTGGGTSATSAADQFSFIAAPTVTALTPNAGPTSGGTSVSIFGTNFTGATAVAFGGTAATSFTVDSAGQITATAPAGAGTVDVRVTTIGGTSATAAADRFTFVGAPTVSSIAPSSGPTAGGASVVITGTNLSGGTVLFGGTPASATVNSSTQITATAPAGSGTVGVTVVTSGGSSGASPFTYVDAPVASSFVAGTVPFNAGGGATTFIDLSSHVTNAPTTFAVGSTTTASGGFVSVDTAGQASYQPPFGFSGSDSFTFTATNAGGTSAPATVTIPVGAPVVALSPSTLANGTVAAAYSQTLTAGGGIAPYTFAVTAGSLPTGLSVTAGGVLQGTPIAAGSFTFTVTATDSSGAPGPYTGSRSYTLNIAQGDQSIAFANPGSQVYGTSPTLTASASSGLAVSFSSSTTNVCTVTSTGTLTFVTIGSCTIAADQEGNANYLAAATVSQTFTVATPPLTATTAGSVNATVGQPLAPVTPVTVSGGQPGYSYALTGTLPAGLSFSTASGAISGTPTANLAATGFTVTATDSLGQTASDSFQLAVAAPTITLSPATLPTAVSGEAYSATVTASGGTAPYSFAVTAGALPPGLALSPGGVISGTPTAAGTFNLSIRATDSSTGSGPFTGTAAYALRVDLPPPPTIAPVSAQTTPGNTSGNIQSLAIDLAGYVSGQYGSLAIGTAPAHGTVTLSGTTATYTPAVGYSGSDSFTFTATGPGGTSAPATVSINVEGVEPSAANLSANAMQSVPVMVDLTTGAVGGPFTGATVVSVSPAGALSTSISAGPSGTFVLTATPSPTFDGVATVTYTLSNDFGASAPATVTITVAARPNPTADATVNGVSSAQADAARRFGTTQMANFQRRNEQLHHGGGAGVSTMISLSGGDGERLRQAKLAFNVPGWTAPGDIASPAMASDSVQPTEVLSLAPPAPTLAARPVGTLALWSGGALSFGSRDGVAARDDLDFNSQGLSFGADVNVTHALTIGVGGGLGWDRTDVGDDEGRVRSKAWSLAAYGSLMATPNVFVDGVVGVADLDHDTRRLAGNGETATGQRDGNMTFASLSTGYDGRSGNTDLSVYAKLDWLRARLGAYVEEGAGIYDLAFAKRNVTSLAGVLGARAGWQLDGWRPHLRAEWRHEFKGLDDQWLDYADTGAYRYALGADRWSSNSFSAEAGADVTLGGRWTGAFEAGVGVGDATRYGTLRLMIAKQF